MKNMLFTDSCFCDCLSILKNVKIDVNDRCGGIGKFNR